MEGRTVTPSYYEGASIYFSDIVGFTTISSDSSPMEVCILAVGEFGVVSGG